MLNGHMDANRICLNIF